METTERAPIVSDHDLDGWDPGRRFFTHSFPDRESVRDFYEAKISGGELRVVKTCHHIRVETGGGVSMLCSSCKKDRYWDVHMKYCPDCGSKIAT